MGNKRMALIVVDMQNDFVSPRGTLVVPEAMCLMGTINRRIQDPQYSVVVYTQDWHPPGHKSFASSWPGRKPFERWVRPGSCACGHTLWPDHCIQGTWGAEFIRGLDMSSRRAALRIRKGTHQEIDSYSAFYDNDHQTHTSLHYILANLRITALDIVGVATDYCVLHTVQDASAHGYTVRVVRNAVRGLAEHDQALAAMALLTDVTII